MMYFQVQDKITQVQGEKSEIQSSPLDCYSIPLNQLKVAYQQKINKRKRPITCPFEAQIAILFFFFTVFKGHYKLTLNKVF